MQMMAWGFVEGSHFLDEVRVVQICDSPDPSSPRSLYMT